jgi:hypothetical protein
MNFNIDIARDGFSATRNTEDGPVQVWEEYSVIIATSERGDRWSLADIGKGAGLVISDDEATMREVLAALDHNPDTQPVRWLPCDPVYGSDAWDDDAEHSLACFEADCYGEPRPRW